MKYIEVFNQVMGVIASGVLIYGYFQTSTKKSKNYHNISSFLFTIHFFLLNADLGAIYSLLGVLRGIIWKFSIHRYVIYLILILYAIVGIVFYESIISLTIIFATLIGSYSFFYHEGLVFRIVMAITMILWIIYNIHYDSIGGVITNFFILFSTFYIIIKKYT